MNDKDKKFLDSLTSSNIVPVFDRINDETMDRFLYVYSSIITKGAKDIFVAISSGGGSIEVCLEMFDLIKHFPGPTTGLVFGKAMSAAAIVLQACNTRLATANARVLIHHGKCEFNNAFLFDDKKLQNFLSQKRKFEDRIAKIFSERTNKSVEEVLSLTGEDRPISVQEAIDFGLLDGVWDKPLPFKTS